MIGDAPALLALAGVPRSPLALSIALGALAVGFGVALMADGRLPDLARRRAAADPLADGRRSSPSASSASRGRWRATSSGSPLTTSPSARSGGSGPRFFERIEPLAPAQLEGYRRGDLLAGWSATSMRCRACTCAASPAARRARGRRGVRRSRGGVLPSPASCSPSGSLVGGHRGPGGRVGSAARRSPPAAARASYRRARRAPARRAGARRLRPRERRRWRACARQTASSFASVVATRSSAGLGRRLSILVAGLTAVGVLAVAVSAHAAGALDRVLVAALALLALASFEAVAPLPSAARELSATLAPGDACSSSPTASPPSRPASRRRAPPAAARRARRRHRPLRGGDEPASSSVSTFGSTRASA